MEEEEFGRPLNDASRVRSRDRAWISMPDRYCDALPSQSHRRHLLPLALRVRPHGEALRHVTGTCSLVLQDQSYIDGHINQEHLLLQNYRQIRPCVLQSSSSRHGGRVEVRGRVSQPFIAFLLFDGEITPSTTISHPSSASKLALAPRLPAAKLLIHLAHLDLGRSRRSLGLLPPLLFPDLPRGLRAGAGRHVPRAGGLRGRAARDGVEIGGALTSMVVRLSGWPGRV